MAFGASAQNLSENALGASRPARPAGLQDANPRRAQRAAPALDQNQLLQMNAVARARVLTSATRPPCTDVADPSRSCVPLASGIRSWTRDPRAQPPIFLRSSFIAAQRLNDVPPRRLWLLWWRTRSEGPRCALSPT